jgi:ABC-2 type transport system permease protein
MIIGPLLTSALLSNAFKEMMSSAYTIEDFKVGYRISESGKYKEMISGLPSICKEKGITLQEYPQGDIEKLLQSETVTVFVDIKDNSYIVYQASGKDKEAAVVGSIFNSFFYQANEAVTALTYSKEHGTVATEVQNIKPVATEALNVDPVPNSTDYYGIIYIIYFGWCGMLSLAEVISSERKSAIPKRMRVAHMPKLSYYLGKFIPCSMAVFFQLCCAWALSALLLGVHWGRPLLSGMLLFILSIAVGAFSMVLYQLFKKIAVCTIAGFILVWIAGFFGGSFEPYMYLNIPEYLIHSSPIYYLDRTLVEFSTKGSSDYLGICLLYMTGFIAVSVLIGILLMNRKMEEA